MTYTKRNLLLTFFLLLAEIAPAGDQVHVKKSNFTRFEKEFLHSNPVIAQNTITGESLIVWERWHQPVDSDQILGRLIKSNGIPDGAQFTIVNDRLAYKPWIAFNPVFQEFLLVYDNSNSSQSKIFALRLNSKGRPIGSPINITADSVSSQMTNIFPRLAFNPTTGGYVVFWMRGSLSQAQFEEGHDGMVGVLLTPEGKTSGKVVMIQKSIEPNLTAEFVSIEVIYHPSANKILLLFTQREPSNFANYWLATLDPMLKNVNASTKAKINKAPVTRRHDDRNNRLRLGACIAIFSDRPGMVFYVDNLNLKRRKIDLKGKLSGNSFNAYNEPVQDIEILDPSVAFSTISKGTRGLLVGNLDPAGTSGEISHWAQLLDVNGLPVGSAVRVNENSASDITQFGSALGTLVPTPADSLYRFNWFGSIGKSIGSGIIRLNLSVD